MRSRNGVVLTVCVALLGVLLLLMNVDERGAPTVSADGPLHFEDDPFGSFAGGIAIDAPAQVAFGLTLVRNDAGLPVTFSSAFLTPLGTADGASVDALVLPLDGRGLAGIHRWPHQGFMRRTESVHGFVLAPGGEAQVLFVVTLGKTGEYQWTRPTLTYRLNGVTYTAVSSGSYYICPAGSTTEPCPSSGGSA